MRPENQEILVAAGLDRGDAASATWLHRAMPARVVTLLLALLLAVPVLLLSSAPAHACSCAELTPAEMVDGSSAVFAGVVEDSRDGGDDRRVTALRVDRVWGGTVTERTEVVHGVESSSCGIDPGDGERLVVAADLVDGQLRTGLCSVRNGQAAIDEMVAALGAGDRPAAGTTAAASDDGPPVGWIAAGGGLVLLAALALVVRRRRSAG